MLPCLDPYAMTRQQAGGSPMGRHLGPKRRLHYAVLVGLLLLAGLTSSFAAERLKELRVAQIGSPSAMDCWNFTAVDEGDIIRHFLEPLFDFDRQGVVHGALVESWEMHSPTEWLLRLRKGVKFHDPEYGEVKAEDVVASLDTCARETARSATAFPKPILQHQAEMLDEYTIRLTLPEPGTGALPHNFAYAYVYPKKYLALGKEQVARRPIGAGPYRFVEWVPNQRIVAISVLSSSALKGTGARSSSSTASSGASSPTPSPAKASS